MKTEKITRERATARALLIGEKFNRLGKALEREDRELVLEMIDDLERLFPELREYLYLNRFV